MRRIVPQPSAAGHLVTEAELCAVRDRIRRMNSHVRMHVTQHCEVPLEEITGVHPSSLTRALTLDPQLFDDAAHDHDGEVSAVCTAREGVIDVAACRARIASR